MCACDILGKVSKKSDATLGRELERTVGGSSAVGGPGAKWSREGSNCRVRNSGPEPSCRDVYIREVLCNYSNFSFVKKGSQVSGASWCD